MIDVFGITVILTDVLPSLSRSLALSMPLSEKKGVSVSGSVLSSLPGRDEVLADEDTVDEDGAHVNKSLG
jgi:hypothetical protein